MFSRLQSAFTNLMNTRKPVITIYAEQNGPLTSGKYEWSFRNGALRMAHSNSGDTMMASGRALCMGLTAFGIGAQSGTFSAAGSAIFILVVNGTPIIPYVMNKPKNNLTGITPFDPTTADSSNTTFDMPFELSLGNRINFQSGKDCSDATCAVASLLIELEL